MIIMSYCGWLTSSRQCGLRLVTFWCSHCMPPMQSSWYSLTDPGSLSAAIVSSVEALAPMVSIITPMISMPYLLPPILGFALCLILLDALVTSLCLQFICWLYRVRKPACMSTRYCWVLKSSCGLSSVVCMSHCSCRDWLMIVQVCSCTVFVVCVESRALATLVFSRLVTLLFVLVSSRCTLRL